MKTLNRLFKRDKEKFIVPRSAQDIIPIKAIWEDGIFLVGTDKYSKSFKFLDINYAVASKEDKEAMFIDYSDLLNSLDTGATAKITINNRRINKIDFEKQILLKMQNDDLDRYRKEYNEMLINQAKDANEIIQEKIITLSVYKKSIEEARTYFSRVGADLISKFATLGSKCMELDAVERLRILHDFYRTGNETSFRFDFKETIRKGHNFKDFICPDSFEFKDDYFKIGDRYGKVMFLKEYASFVKDSMVTELTELNKNMMLSIDIIPVPQDEAVKEAENRRMGIETNITNWQRKQNANNNFSAIIPYDMEQQRAESKEFLDDLTTRDQRMFLVVITMVITADTKQELDNTRDDIEQIASKGLCQMGTLKFQQLDGLNQVLPIVSNFNNIKALRTLTTESLAVFIPFKVQEIRHEGGIFYGQNVISKNMIIADRNQLLNGNSFTLGVSGSGKSFISKEEIASIKLKDKDADIIIIDPEREYSKLVRAFGGEVIKISATSRNHINAMDMTKDYGDGANPVILKSEFILSLCEQLIGSSNLGAKQKSIIDRCTANTYRFYQQGNYQGTPPTLQDFREELLKQDEPEAKEIALAIELFTNGSLNTFAMNTNVDTSNSLLCYDILDLGKQLLPIGMLVVLDSILNRITSNRNKGKHTYIFIDEIYLLFQYEYSANFLFTLWKRVRKYGACCTGITQNVEDLLQSHTARTMLANSEFIIMLNQASTDRTELARLLNISDLQMSYITNVKAGEGLIKIGSVLVPFVNKFPRNTELYKLMSTKPGEEFEE
ncbi:VirB4-like conjugal transfer ATPase, CD1110 family [Megamonas funiformis]|uniref:VirB4-like conjugal transfer ATPase, CD1110 family n=1 Tax=Megamonas funiformis TaxID=437897 RepID=UPI003F8118C5